MRAIRTGLFFIVACTLPQLARGKDSLPPPMGYSGNLEGVRVQDVIPSFLHSPDPSLAKSIEDKIKAALKSKDLLGKVKNFAVLIPSLTCDVPYGKPDGEKVCHVSLTLQERVAPPGPSKERVPWGIMTSYHSEFPFPFAYKKELIETAFEALLKDFIQQVTARRPSSASNTLGTGK